MAAKKHVTVELDDLREVVDSSNPAADAVMYDIEQNAKNTKIIHSAAQIALENAEILDELAEMGHAEDDIYAARSFVGDLLGDPDGPSINGF